MRAPSARSHITHTIYRRAAPRETRARGPRRHARRPARPAAPPTRRHRVADRRADGLRHAPCWPACSAQLARPPAPTRNFDRNSVRRTSDDCPRVFTRGDYSFIHWRATARHDSVSQSQLLSRSCPRAHPSTGSPRIRLRRSRSNGKYRVLAPASRGAGATQLSQVRSISPVMTVHMPCQILYAQSQFTCLSSLRCETAPSRSSLASTLKHCARESPIPDRPARRSRRLHAPRPR